MDDNHQTFVCQRARIAHYRSFRMFQGSGGGESACRRDSVREPVAWVSLDGHPSLRSTRECLRAGRPLPARSCSGWGLPSRSGRPERWCALTAPFHPCRRRPAVCSLWHFPASRLDWPLASTLPCGVPTFLDPPQRTATIRPAPRHRCKPRGRAGRYATPAHTGEAVAGAPVSAASRSGNDTAATRQALAYPRSSSLA